MSNLKSGKIKVPVKIIFCATSDFYQMQIQLYSTANFIILKVIKFDFLWCQFKNLFLIEMLWLAIELFECNF